MSPTGLHVNKPVLAAICIGILVVIYLWFRHSSPSSTMEVKMNEINKAKTAMDKVKIHHDIKLTFKVGQKDVTIAYREVKPSSPKMDILFLHGMGDKSEIWVSKPLFTLQLMYSLNYRAIAIDMPGFGDSPKTDVDKAEFMAAVISTLKLDRPVIVAPSMSGSYVLPYLLTDALNADKKSRGFVPVAPVGTEKYNNEQYQVCKVPTLIIYGSTDKSLGFTSRDKLKNVPNNKVVEIEGGHAFYFEKPDEFHKNLLAFLAALKK